MAVHGKYHDKKAGDFIHGQVLIALYEACGIFSLRVLIGTFAKFLIFDTLFLALAILSSWPNTSHPKVP
jgi:hypothetical protein